jgi:UDP-2,3-diacylglucosamine hydrolase
MLKKLSNAKKIYFASDMHFGTPTKEDSRAREQKFIRFLNEIQKDASELFLVGDVFDFWFDYKTVVPKGFTRLFGKLAELSDQGIKIHYFKGNHDMWLNGYFEEELGFIIHSDNLEIERNGFKLFIGHGDGKGPKDYKYKFLKKIFRNPMFIWFFKWIHPDIGMAFAQLSSKSSRYGQGVPQKEVFHGAENEWLISYVKRKLENEHYDYFVFGHRHLAIDFEITDKIKYINLGDWLYFSSYAVLDNNKLELRYFEKDSTIH